MKAYILEPSHNPHKISLYYEHTNHPDILKITLDLSQSQITLTKQEQAKLKTNSRTKATLNILRSNLIETTTLLLEMVYVKIRLNSLPTTFSPNSHFP